MYISFQANALEKTKRRSIHRPLAIREIGSMHTSQILGPDAGETAPKKSLRSARMAVFVRKRVSAMLNRGSPSGSPRNRQGSTRVGEGGRGR